MRPRAPAVATLVLALLGQVPAVLAAQTKEEIFQQVFGRTGTTGSAATDDGSQAPDAPAAQAATDRDAIFRQVFGGEPKGGEGAATTTQTLPGPLTLGLVVDGITLAELPVEFAAAPELSTLPAAEFLAAVHLLVLPEILAALEAAAEDERLTFLAIRDSGLGLEFNEAQLQLDLTVPQPLRQVVVITGGSTRTVPEGAAVVEPAAVSAYVNMLAGAAYDHGGGTLEAGVTLQGVANLMGLVVEADGYAQVRPDPLLQLGDLRALTHLPDEDLTLQVGDLVYAPVGQGRVRPLFGVGLDKCASLTPGQIVTAAAEREFILERPATVELYVNGLLTDTLRLPANRYSLRDLPFTDGANDVRVVARDDQGRVEEFRFDYIYDRSLLREGLDVWGATLGTLGTDSGKDWSLDGEVGFSAFYQRGVAEDLTLGAYVQGGLDQQVAGAQALWATGIGLFNLDVAGSRAGSAPPDWSIAGNWTLHDQSEEGLARRRVFSLSLDLRTPGYTDWGGAAVDATQIDVTGVVAQDFGTWGAGSLTGFYRDDGGGARYGGGLSLRYSLADGITLTASLQGELGADPGVAGFVGISLPLGERAYGNAGFSTERQELRLQAQQGSVEGDWSLLANARYRPGEVDLGGRARVSGEKATAELRHDQVFDETGGGLSVATAGTALVFADGYAGLSRPIGDSFAIVVPHESLDGVDVAVNPNRWGPQATNGIGLPVVANLQSYGVARVAIDAPDAPVTLDLGNQHPYVESGYRTGSVVRFGQAPTAAISGRLLASDGTPLALAAGRVVEIEGLSFFTNREGQFLVAGLPPGEYTLQLAQGSVRVSVGEELAATQALGDLTMNAPAKAAL